MAWLAKAKASAATASVASNSTPVRRRAAIAPARATASWALTASSPVNPSALSRWRPSQWSYASASGRSTEAAPGPSSFERASMSKVT